MFDVWVSLVFGVVAYVLRKYDWPLAPFLLAYILGPLLEKYLLQSLSMSGGSVAIFFQRGLALSLLAAATVLLTVSLVLVRSSIGRARPLVAEAAGP